MYSEEVMMEFPYEDLSLFNGDLLLEDAEQTAPTVAPLGRKDEVVFSDAVATPKITVQLALAQPQNGSQQFSLQDLLATTPSPTQDLPDPFGQTSAWFDTKTDIDELLSGIEQPQSTLHQENVQTITIQQYDSPASESAHHLFSSTDNLESLEAIHTLLSADVPVTQSFHAEALGNEQCVVYIPETLQEPTDQAMDFLDEIAEEGLEQLLSGAPFYDQVDTAALLDNPVLSPVSADDVESLLSSNPASPTDQSTLSSLYSSFTESSQLETIDLGSLSDRASIVRPVREKARSAPYTLSSPSSSSSSATSSPRKKGDRRERKKEQNRTAALRYREKKRSEQDVVQQEVDELIEKNTSLKGQVDSVEKEIKYLKDLMAEVQNAKAKMKRCKTGGAL